MLDPDSHPATGLVGAVRRHPSGILLLAQLLAILAYPFLGRQHLGRALLGAVGTGWCWSRCGPCAARPRSPGWPCCSACRRCCSASSRRCCPDQDWVVLTSALLHAPFYFYVSYGMIRYLFHDDRVTTDELYATGAAFTVVAWGFAYVFVAVPGDLAGLVRRHRGRDEPTRGSTCCSCRSPT